MRAATYLEMKQYIIDLERPATLKSYYLDKTDFLLSAEIARLANQLLASGVEMPSRAPPMPRCYNMSLEEVVAPLFRAADRYQDPLIRNIANDLLCRYGDAVAPEADGIKRL